jgi:hypothetical protein
LESIKKINADLKKLWRKCWNWIKRH